MTTMTESALQEALHSATRSLHTQLNKAITARLPLCLPPNVTDPTAYLFGIVVFGQIFVSFEEGIEQASKLGNNNHDAAYNKHLKILRTAHTDGLKRTDKLRNDIRLLQERLDCAAQVAQVQQYAESELQCMTKSIREMPYLALAYEWTMYLALFNGGRFLQRALASAGPKFWLEQSDSESIEALSFWDFDAATPDDPQAEALKMRLKANLTAAGELLTPEEKDRVVEESVQLFQTCIGLVTHLDEIMAQNTAGATPQRTMSRSATAPCRSASSRLWDTVRSTSSGFVDDWLGSLWRRPLAQEVKD